MFIHILIICSRSKDNQTMKLGELIEYSPRNIFNKVIQQDRSAKHQN